MNEEKRAALIEFGLQRLKELNGFHRFELLCLDFTRIRLEPDLLPATGPVGRGGDRGLDFESFGDAGIGAACNMWEQKRIAGKIRTDIRAAVERGRPLRKFYAFASEPFQAAERANLRDELEAEYGIQVEIFDGHGLAKQLAAPDLLEIAEEHLAIPLFRHMAQSRLPRALGLAGEIDPGAGRGGRTVGPRIQRDAEGELREAFELALGRGGISLVRVEGEFSSGRTFAALAALGAVAAQLPTHLATTAEELWSWLGLEHAEPAALLLDRFERVADEGGAALIDFERGHDGWRPPLLLIAIDSPPALGDADPRPLRADAVIEVETMLMPHELEQARRLIKAGDIEEVERWGLGPASVAGPRLASRYRRAAGAAGTGRRLVETIVCWGRAGFREDLDEETLRSVDRALGRDRAPALAWEQAVTWALEEALPGHSAARFDGYRWTAHPAVASQALPRGWQKRWLEEDVWEELRRWAGEDAGRLASLGTASARLGDPTTAASVLGEAIESGSVRARLNLALLHLGRRPARVGEARALLTALRDELEGRRGRGPAENEALALTLRALGRLDHGEDPGGAAAAYRDAALLGDPEAMVNLAQLEREAGRDAVALQILWTAARRGSVLAAAALMLDVEVALDRAAADLNPSEVELLGALLLRNHRRADAERCFERAAAAGRLPAQAQLGGMLLERDRDAAIEVLEPAVERGSRVATEYLGRALRRDHPERARRLLRRAYELGSSSAGEALLSLLDDGDAGASGEATRLRVELGQPVSDRGTPAR